MENRIKECKYMLNWVYKQIESIKSRKPIPNTTHQISQSAKLKGYNEMKTKLESRLDKLYRRNYQ